MDHGSGEIQGEGQLLLFQFGLGLEGRNPLFCRLFQIKLLIFQLELGLLCAGHFQDVIDQLQQLGSGQGDFLETAGDFLGVIPLILSQAGRTQYYIEWGAHIVAHLGEKLALGLFAVPGPFQSSFQHVQMLKLAGLFLVHLAEAEHRFLRLERGGKKQAYIDPAVLIAEFSPEVSAEV